jgi:hypothetical protein
MRYTDHARKRSQQRGIPTEVVNLLLEYGETKYAGRGCKICAFRSKHGKRELLREGTIRGVNIEKHLRAFLVIFKDETIVTVGHRYKRVKRDFTERKRCSPRIYH